LKKNTTIIIAAVLIIVIAISSFGIYSLYTPKSSEPEPTATSTPQSTLTPTIQPTLTTVPTSSITSVPTASPTFEPTLTPTLTPIESATPIATTTSTPTPTVSASATPQPTATSQPTATATPQPTLTASPKPTSLTYTDVTGAETAVQLPVNRVVAIMATDLVVAIGGQSKIVGRGNIDASGLALLPAGVGDIPVAGSVEKVLELEPDLVLVSELYGDTNVELLRNAGIAVIVDRTVQPRRSILVDSLGIMLGVEERATQFNNFELYYQNLVATRVANLTDIEKPLIYFEFYMPGYSTGPGNSFHDLIVEAGGINIANESVPVPILSTEYVIEKNPDIILRMLTYLDGYELSSFQALRDEMMTRNGMSEVKAVQDGDVYIVRDAIIVSRETIGLLYYAKWFHPDLFADINPAEIDAEYLQTFFGVTLTGVWSYP
jgi:iron complex transport system substrate-binding protein